MDQSRIRDAQDYKHKCEIMYRSSHMNEDRTRVLLYNNPPPNLNDWAGEQSGPDRYMPSWVPETDSVSTRCYISCWAPNSQSVSTHRHMPFWAPDTVHKYPSLHAVLGPKYSVHKYPSLHAILGPQHSVHKYPPLHTILGPHTQSVSTHHYIPSCPSP